MGLIAARLREGLTGHHGEGDGVRTSSFQPVLLKILRRYPRGWFFQLPTSNFQPPEWRRGRDSNPRDPFGPNGFQDRRIKPLSHPSGRHSLTAKAQPSKNEDWAPGQAVRFSRLVFQPKYETIFAQLSNEARERLRIRKTKTPNLTVHRSCNTPNFDDGACGCVATDFQLFGENTAGQNIRVGCVKLIPT